MAASIFISYQSCDKVGTVTTAIVAKSTRLPQAAFKVDIIRSPLYDLVFFICPFWFTGLYALAIHALPTYQPLIFLLTYAFLAEAHFGSTWSFYLDAENRAFFRRSPLVFYWVPLAILIASLVLARFLGMATLLLLVAPLSAFHITRQSIGVVGIYRTRADDFSRVGRRLEEVSIYCGTVCFMGLAFARSLAERFAGSSFLEGTSGRIIHSMVGPLGWLAYAAAVIGAVCAVAAIVRQALLYVDRGQPISLVRWIVFFYSVFLFAPYVVCARFDDAVAMGVGMHYLQYLGLVWMINRNKYGGASTDASWTGELLRATGSSWQARVLVLGGYGLLMLVLRQGGLDLSRAETGSWLYVFPVALNTIHFHVDRYLWRFSDPYIRTAVLPYLR